MSVLQELHTKIKDSSKPIRIRGILKKRKETLEEFLIKFFNKWNNEKDTIYVEDESVQTDPGKRRSIGDIFLIARYYYPRCTLRQVAEALYGPVAQKATRFRSSYCNTIKKRVFYKGDENQGANLYDTEKQDEHGLTVSAWKQNL